MTSRLRLTSTEFNGEVGPATLLQFLLAAVRRDGLHQRNSVFRLEDFRLQPDHVTAGDRAPMRNGADSGLSTVR